MSGSKDASSCDNHKQPEITDYITYECSVCGRPYDEKGAACHPASMIKAQRQLATGEWLLTSQRPPKALGGYSALGPDRVTFECLYAMLRPLIDSKSAQFTEYFEEFPLDIPSQKWVSRAYKQDLRVTNELVMGLQAAIRACETRVKQRSDDVAPSDVFAHLVFLDQYGLIPGYRSLRSSGSLREFCSKHYNAEVDELRSEWVVERRVDRSKVFSTTKDFRQAWGLELTGETPSSHPHAEFKPFNGTSVLGDHRDHNLVTKKAKRDLLSRPYVDWTTAPHIFYSRSGYGTAEDPETNTLPVLGFDFAGFSSPPYGRKLRYLGIVTEHEEDLFEVYLQVVQISKTDANGIVIMPTRRSIYEFLDFLKVKELVSEADVLLKSIEDYRSIPNVRSLHEKVIRHIGFLDGIALIPRRKFMDEGFENIGDLISVPTYA